MASMLHEREVLVDNNNYDEYFDSVVANDSESVNHCIIITCSDSVVS